MSMRTEFELSGDAAAALEQLSSQPGLSRGRVIEALSALVCQRLTGADAGALESPGITIQDETETEVWLREWTPGTEPQPAQLVVEAAEGPRAAIAVRYEPDHCTADEIERFSRCFSAALERLPAQLSQPLGSLDIVPAPDREKALREWNATTVEYPTGKCVHELFEEQASRTPEAVAVVFEDRQMTYHELDLCANQLARRLLKRGTGAEALVGICMRRTPELLAGMLAILKTGAAYVPLDPSFPKRRLEAMLEDSGITTVLTERSFSGALFPSHIRTVLIDGEAEPIEAESTERLRRAVAPEHLAYVIYTSGSTGKPKGVMVEHRNVVNFFTAMDPVAGGQDAGTWLAVTSICFDISVLELLWTLARGFRVVLLGDDAAHARDGKYSIASLLREQRVTHLQCTPSLARMLASDPDSLREMARLRKLFLGGEAVPVSLIEQLRPVVAGEIHNMYGPTETTIWSTTHRIEEGPGISGATVSIGKPVANTEVYILDSKRRLLPPRAAGELYIGGAGVVRGYLNRPDLTAERFVPNPFRPGETARIYRTGDLARHRPDGTIDYLGRLDHQVKIRGFRIELGEIEAALERCAGVRQAVVVAREDKPGDKRLAAYLVIEPEHNPSVSELRRHLEGFLPDYMIPAMFVALERMPLTANGKIDRLALPNPEGREMRDLAAYAAPSKDLEKIIAEVWQEALGVERVGIYDNFFDLGAHSLLVAEVHIQLRQVLEREFSLLDMFRHSTVHALASHLSGEAAHQDAGEAQDSTQPRAADRGQARRESMKVRSRRQGVGAA